MVKELLNMHNQCNEHDKNSAVPSILNLASYGQASSGWKRTLGISSEYL